MQLNRYVLTLLAFIFSGSAFATTLTLDGYVANTSSAITVEYSLDGWKTSHMTNTDSKGNFYDTISTSATAVTIDLKIMTCDSSYDSTYVFWSVRDTTTTLYPRLDYCNNSTKKCNADFSISVSGKTVTLRNNSTGFNPTFQWNTGDGKSYTSTNVTHTYKADSTYTICLIATDTVMSCADTVCKTVTIRSSGGSCKAYFRGSVGYDSNSNPIVYLFNASQASSSATYQWVLSGPGVSDTFRTKNVTTKQKPGLYQVCLKVMDGSCFDSYCDSIWVDTMRNTPSCNANFSVSISGLSVTFKNNSTGAAYSSWNFGDRSTSSSASPTHTYSSAGTYTVCLVISDSARSCSDSVCKTITVQNTKPACNAKFSVVKDSNNKYGVLIVNQSTGSGLNYRWDFGDGNSSNQKNPSHTYKNFGSYYVCLTVSDSNRCSSTYCDTVGMDSTGKLLKAGFSIQVVDDLTSIEDVELNQKVRAFPNPAQNILTIESDDVELNGVALIDMRGIPCRNVETIEKKENIIQLDLNELPTGMYMLRIDTESGTTVKRIQKM